MAHRLILLVITAGCQTVTTAPKPHCEGKCILDGAPHCISIDGCESDADCPGGLSCTTRIGTLPSCGVAEVDDVRRCNWSAPSVRRNALSAGFRTSSMGAQISGGAVPEIQWEAPPAARYVACALFRCNPVIAPRDLPTKPETSPTGQALLRIANAQSCIFELQVTDASRSSLPLVADVHMVADSICVPEEVFSERLFNFVAAGCWAYDYHDVIAATDLLEIPPGMYEALRVPHDAGCAFEGAECYDAEHAFFGFCLGHECRFPCASTLDCQHAATRFLHTPPAERCDWQCMPQPRAAVGVCAPQ